MAEEKALELINEDSADENTVAVNGNTYTFEVTTDLASSEVFLGAARTVNSSPSPGLMPLPASARAAAPKSASHPESRP